MTRVLVYNSLNEWAKQVQQIKEHLHLPLLKNLFPAVEYPKSKKKNVYAFLETCPEGFTRRFR